MISALKHQLLHHPVYEMVNTHTAITIFMEHHIACVWDFMSLVKRLQRELTCQTPIWTPPTCPRSARFINEIVLDEESDEVVSGEPKSHFELYLQAMEQVGAQTEPMKDLIKALQQNSHSPRQLIQKSQLHESAQKFCLSTLNTLEQPPSHIAAVFYHAREAILPDMFTKFLSQMTAAEDPRFHLLRLYFTRHIDLDTDVHGPIAKKLIEVLTTPQDDPKAIESSVEEALTARLKLWDAVAEAIALRHNTTITRTEHSLPLES